MAERIRPYLKVRARVVSLRIITSLCAVLTICIVQADESLNTEESAEKFIAAIETQGREQSARSVAEQLYQNCVYCHGVQGNAESSFYPRLAGQPPAYLRQQLKAYQDGTRQNRMMSSLALAITAEEIDTLSDYLAAQKIDVNLSRPDSGAFDPISKRTISSAQTCDNCHGDTQARDGGYARLKGQGYHYLVSQLKAYRDGQRSDPTGIMKSITANLSEQNIIDLARHYANQ